MGYSSTYTHGYGRASVYDTGAEKQGFVGRMVSKSKRPKAPPRKPLKTLEDVKVGRLIMRAHPDLVALLDARSAERGVTRSAFIEEVLIGFMHADPRNPRLTAWGKIDPRWPPPRQMYLDSPHKFADKWRRFSDAYEAMFGHPPPRSWAEDDGASWWPIVNWLEDEAEEAAEIERNNAESAAAMKKYLANLAKKRKGG